LKHIWRKSVDADWWQDHGEDFNQRFGPALALINRPGRKRAVLEISCRTEARARKLLHQFGGKVEVLRRGWLRKFVKQIPGKRLRVGSRLEILSAPLKSGAGPHRKSASRSIIIPAEAAFGTGHHATTAMCLRLLERITRRSQPGWMMLDAGTGSGILAIAGSSFGAGHVLALDSDPLACTTAKRNARANGVRNIDFSTSDVLNHKLTRKFDIIVANLFSEIVIAALPIWSRHLDPGGHLILSGILRSQQSAVIRALQRHSFNASEIRRRGKWVAVLAERSTRRRRGLGRRSPNRGRSTSTVARVGQSPRLKKS
jgi:ribosomal protein L11 methyltransferase